MKYFVLTKRGRDGGVIESYPSGGPADWKYSEGISLLASFPANASLIFSFNYPNARKLYDFQPSILSIPIISGRTRKLLESLEVPHLEYLPVAIQDHQGSVVAQDYFLLNPLGGEDAIDMEKSAYKMDSLAKDQIGRIKNLVINPQGIRPESKVFRCKMKRRLVLIREDVHAAFVQAGLTGFHVYAAEGWNGLEL